MTRDELRDLLALEYGESRVDDAIMLEVDAYVNAEILAERAAGDVRVLAEREATKAVLDAVDALLHCPARANPEKLRDLAIRMRELAERRSATGPCPFRVGDGK